MKYMKLWSLALATLLAFVSASCSKKAKPEDKDDVEPITLEIVGDANLLMAFNEVRSIAVRATYNSNGEPAANRKISFLIDGAAGGASLAENEVYTDDSGTAHAELTAGGVKAQFFVVASSGSSNQIQFAVDVNGKEFGNLRVYYALPAQSTIRMTKLIVKVHPALFDCKAYDDWTKLPEAAATKESYSSNLPVMFEDLKSGANYTVTVSAFGPEGNEVARGCAKSATIIGRQIVDTTVSLSLMPTSVIGTYQMATRLNMLSMIPTSNERASASYIVNQVIGFFADPGNWTVNMILNELPSIFTDDNQPEWLKWGTRLVKVVGDGYTSLFCDTHDGVAEGSTEEYYWDKIVVGNGSNNKHYSCWCSTHDGFCGKTNRNCGPTQDQDCSKWEAPKIGELLDMLITKFAPSWVVEVFNVGNSVAAIVQNLVVGGEFEITSATEVVSGDPNKLNIEGKERWNSYMFTWTFGKNCTVNDTCCGEVVFGTGNTLDNKLTAVSAEFKGVATADNIGGQAAYYMNIEPHTLALQYGRILVYVLQNLVFPAVIKSTQEKVTFSDMLINLIPTTSVGCWIGSLASDSDYDTCKESCVVSYDAASKTWIATGTCGATGMVLQVFDAAGKFIDDKISALDTQGKEEYKFQLTTDSQYVTENILVDSNYDLQADHMQLKLKGNVYLGDAVNEATSVTGSMEADFARVVDPDNEFDRTTCHSDKQCVSAIGEGRTCQIREGIVSKCAERMVCALNVGSYAGASSCMSDADCQSGYCMRDTKTCYSACSSSSDCQVAGATVCNSNITYSFDDGINAVVSGCKAN